MWPLWKSPEGLRFPTHNLESLAMAVRALAANNEVVASTETYVSSKLAFHVRVSLPPINDGTGGTVAVGKEIRFDALGTSSIEIVTLKGVRVGIVPSRHSACVVARAGQGARRARQVGAGARS